jgi:hypothetical protein
MLRRRTCVLIFLISLALASCSSSKTISPDELRSDLLAAVSLASETEMLIDQLLEGRVTSAFAEGHLTYLEKEALNSASELRRARADERMASVLETGRAQVDSLATMLGALRKRTDDKEYLSVGTKQAARMRVTLEQAKDEL